MSLCNMNIKDADIDNMNMCNEMVGSIDLKIFLIRNKANGLYITSSGTNGGPVTQENAKSDFLRQRWLFTPVDSTSPSSSFYIFDTSTNYVMSLVRPSTENGVELITTTNNDQVDKRWFVDVFPDNRGAHFLLNDLSSKVLDNPRASTSPGTVQTQFDFNGGDAQRFSLILMAPTDAELDFMRTLK